MSWTFEAGGVQVVVGATGADGRVTITATGPATPDAGGVASALAARDATRAELVEAARLRMPDELNRLTEARRTFAAAQEEQRAANRALTAAQTAHATALKEARNPTVTRRVVGEMEDRVRDALLWVQNAQARVTEAEHLVHATGASAWLAELSARAPDLAALKEVTAADVCEGLAAVLRAVLVAFPLLDVARTGPGEALAAPAPEERIALLKLAAG